MGRARHVIWPNQKNLYFSNSYTVNIYYSSFTAKHFLSERHSAMVLIGRVKRDPPPPPSHLGLDFSYIYVLYIHTYVRTFLIRVRMFVICNRNSIATKREEFPARLIEVASSCLYFASRASLLQLLQQTYSALCQQPVWKSV